MNIKIILIVLSLTYSTSAISQITTSVIENSPKENKKNKEIKMYDKILDIQNLRNIDDYKMYIGYEIYSTGISRKFYDSNRKSTTIGKGYFLITDVTRLTLTFAGNVELPDSPVLKLENKETKEIYYLSLNSFDLRGVIFVPFFVQQKEAYDNKKFIIISSFPNNLNGVTINERKEVGEFYGGEWTCSVNVIEKLGSIFYILKNEFGETLNYNQIGNGPNDFHITKNINDTRTNMNFMLVDDINRLEKEKTDAVLEKQNLKVRTLKELIEKYGKEKATLISEGNVEIGMTKEMCIDAWGEPLYTRTTSIKNNKRDLLTYSWNKNLLFENDILIKSEY